MFRDRHDARLLEYIFKKVQHEDFEASSEIVGWIGEGFQVDILEDVAHLYAIVIKPLLFFNGILIQVLTHYESHEWIVRHLTNTLILVDIIL